MRDTVLALVHDPGELHQAEIVDSIRQMVASVAAYVPGYRLKQDVQFTPLDPHDPWHVLSGGAPVSHKVAIFLEVEGAAHYLPAYAGNLDIMTSAALRVGEVIASAERVRA